MTQQNGLPGHRIEVEVTAAMELAHRVQQSGERMLEQVLQGQPPSTLDILNARVALDDLVNTSTIDVSVGTPTHYWQGWLIQDWLPRGCVAMLTGDGGVGKSRLALQLAWAMSGGGQWLGEAGQIPAPGADYGEGFEPLAPSNVVYATWEDSPDQIRGRLYWLERQGKGGSEAGFLIADMRPHGHVWAASSRYEQPGLTPAGSQLRQIVETYDARLLVIDTLGVANGASEIDRAQVGAFFADWAAWADKKDCAVLLIAHPPKTAGVQYSGSTGMLGGVRALWTVESNRRECQVACPGKCSCDPSYAYRLVNAKQNYAAGTGSVWLSSVGAIWTESMSGPDYRSAS